MAASTSFQRPQRQHTFLSRTSALVRARFDRRRFVAIVLVVVIGLLTARTIERSWAVQANLGQTSPVVVATRTLPAGHLVEPDDVVIRSRPVGHLPPGSLDSMSLAVGTTVERSISEGEAVLAHRLTGNRLGLNIDERAVTVALPFAPPPLEPGDIVDLVGVGAAIGGGSFDGPVAVASSPLGQGRVLFADESGITLAVALQQVRPILEQMGQGTVELVVTPFG